MNILYINYTKKESGGFVHTSKFVEAGNLLGHSIIVYPKLNNTARENRKTTNKFIKRKNIVAISSYFKRCYIFIEKYLFDLIYFKTVIIKGFFFNIMSEYRKIKEVKPEVVILRAGQFYSSIFICKYLKIPFVIEVNGPISEINYKESGHLKFEKFWSWLLEAKILKLADNIIVVSEPLRQYYITLGLNPANIYTVPNGVDTNTFFPDHPRENEIIEKFDLYDSKIIGFTGNFRIWHGLETFFDIFPEIAAEINNVKLLVIGDGPEKEKLLAKVSELGISKHVIFVGRINHEDMPALISVFDVAVAPYAQNDFFYFSPLKIFEYMASGCVVVAPALGQINELIEDGISGKLYNADHLHELISSICRLLRDDQARERMGRAAHLRVHQNFTWLINAENVIQVCKAMVK